MLMNAQPRAVSHGFRPFVPRNRVGSYQRLFHMPPNNEVNAWDDISSVDPNMPNDTWGYGFGQVNDDGNFVFTPSPYAGCFQTEVSNPSARAPDQNRMSIQSSMVWREQPIPAKQQVAQTQYDFQQTSSTLFENQRALLECNHQNWIAQSTTGIRLSARSHLSFSALSGHVPRNPESRSLIGMSSSINEMSNHGIMDSPCPSDSLGSDRTSPSTVYINGIPAAEITSDPMAASFNSLAVHDNMNDGKWWDDLLQDSASTCSSSTLVPFAYDSLPGQRDIFQASSTVPIGNWSHQTVPLGTVSPQALTLNRSSTSMMFSEAACTFKTSLLEPRSSPPAAATFISFQSPETEAQQSQNYSHSARARQKLPSKPITRLQVPILPSSDRGIRKSEKNLSHTTKSASDRGSAVKHKSNESSSRGTRHAGTSRVLIPKFDLKSTDAESKAGIKVLQEPTTSSSEEKNKVVQRRGDLDDFLVKSKKAGMSYKEIRRRGGFTEAESTLRGRFRTLTKKKDERVRRPEWEENDIRLLKNAVRKLSHGSDLSKQKIPWKQVADYIVDNGGSYHFGNATCRKRWDQLQRK